MPLGELVIYLAVAYFGAVVTLGLVGVAFWSGLAILYRPFPHRADFAPSLSIVVPVYDEAPCLRAFLDHLFTAVARYAGKVEVIILDDGSDDGTLAILKEYRRCHDFRLVADGAHLGKLAQLERAFAMVSGEVLVTIDADAFLAPEALGELVSPLSSAACQAVFGNLRPLISPDSAVGLKLFLRLFFAFINHGLRRGQSVLGCLSIIGSNLSALRMSFFKPLWPEISAGALWQAGRDDNAFALHFLRAGAKTVFQQTAVAYSQAPSQARIVGAGDLILT